MTDSAPGQVANPAPALRNARQPLWYLAILYVLATMWGVRQAYALEPSTLDELFPVAIALVLGSWAIVDAVCRGHSLPRLSWAWFFLAATMLVPGYVIWSRRWRGLGWIVLNLVLWIAVATASTYAVGRLLFGRG